MKGIDSATPLSAEKAKQLYADDYAFVVRYYSHNEGKNLSRQEAQNISDAGMVLLTVWEARGNEYDSFTSVQGRADAANAIAQAKACGQPLDTTIFFAVDFDASVGQIEGGISDYFLSASTMTRGAGYLPGSYGSPLVNDTLAAKGYTARSWEAQSRGWAGDHSKPEDMEQGREVTLDGLDVDLDMTDETMQRIGAWALPAAPPMEDKVLAAVMALQSALDLQPDGKWGPLSREAFQAWLDKQQTVG